MLQTNRIDQTRITSPFALYAWFLERMAETKPRVQVPAAALKSFRETIATVRELEGDCIPPSLILNQFYLPVVSNRTAETVECGRDLCWEIASTSDLIYARRDARLSIESLVMCAYMGWDDAEKLSKIRFRKETVRIRSRKSLTKRYGVTVDVEMDNDCLL